MLASERRDDGVARQVPFTEKQPVVRFTPVAKVEVAAVSVVVASPLEMERSVVEAPPLKSWSDEKVLELESKVVEETVMEPPRETGAPLMVMELFWSWLLPMVEVEMNLVPSNERSVPVV